MVSAASPDAKRFVQNGRVIGLALKLSNGWWALYGPEDNRLNPGKAYSSAQRAKTAFAATIPEEG